MRKMLVAALAALTLSAPLVDAAAQGRGGGNGRGRGGEGRAERSYERGAGRWAQDPNMPPRRYNAPPQREGGWGRGQYLPPPARSGQIQDFSRHRLRPPPAGYDWVQVGPDIYLTQRSTGLVVEAIPGGY